MSFWNIYRENRMLSNHVLGFMTAIRHDEKLSYGAIYEISSNESPSKSKKKTGAIWDEILTTLPQDVFAGPSLDASCGRGLVLIKTAQMKEKRQTMRPAGELTPVEQHAGSSSCSYSYGIDVFPSSDREGDHAYATCRNIYAENLSSAVVINTATMLNLPFEDEKFSLVTCNMALSKLSEKDRMQAFHELTRVLSPKGLLVIVDSTPVKPQQSHLTYIQALLSFGMSDLAHRLIKSNSLIGKSSISVITARKAEMPSIDHLET